MRCTCLPYNPNTCLALPTLDTQHLRASPHLIAL